MIGIFYNKVNKGYLPYPLFTFGNGNEGSWRFTLRVRNVMKQIVIKWTSFLNYSNGKILKRYNLSYFTKV